MSPDLGIPVYVASRLFWDPLRYASEEERERIASMDIASSIAHEIGSTDFIYSSNPTWQGLAASPEAKKLKSLLSTEGSFVDTPKNAKPLTCIEYPVLQPFARNDEMESSVLLPWNTSKAGIVVQAMVSDALNLLPGTEYVIGEIEIPFSELLEQKSMSGWFPFYRPGVKRSPKAPRSSAPHVFLHLTWIPPRESDAPSPTDREVSFVLQEELARAAVVSTTSKGGIIDSSIGAFNTVRNVQSTLLVVQNTLGSVLDKIEALRNLLTFSVSSSYKDAQYCFSFQTSPLVSIGIAKGSLQVHSATGINSGSVGCSVVGSHASCHTCDWIGELIRLD